MVEKRKEIKENKLQGRVWVSYPDKSYTIKIN